MISNKAEDVLNEIWKHSPKLYGKGLVKKIIADPINTFRSPISDDENDEET